MRISIETERLILREILPTDVDGMYELDSDPDVHKYLGNRPVTNKGQVVEIIRLIRQQYIDNGIGRWAVIEKSSNEFIGWSGFKLITDIVNNKTQYYDLGYRFIKKHWGKGYATETAIASLNFGFNQLHQKEICAITDIENFASYRLLQKIGMTRINEFDYKNIPHYFYVMNRNEWNKRTIKPKDRDIIINHEGNPFTE